MINSVIAGLFLLHLELSYLLLMRQPLLYFFIPLLYPYILYACISTYSS